MVDDTARLTPAPLRLSVEELAYLLGQVDATEMARSYLRVTFGEELGAEEARQRLIAAGHGLLARGWLSPRGDEPPDLDPEVQAVVEVVAKPDLSVRLTRSTDEPGFGVTLQARGDQLVEQRLEHALVHTLVPFADRAGAIDALAATLGVPGAATHESPTLRVPKPPLDRAMATWSGPDAPPDDATLSADLVSDGVPPDLAEDLAAPVERASLVRVDYHEAGQATADRGLLLLRGRTRYWLVEPGTDESTVQAATLDAFRTAMASVLADTAPTPSETT